MCFIMVFFMDILNISIKMGGLNSTSFLICIKAFPVTFIIVFILENVLVGPINRQLLKYFVGEQDVIYLIFLFNPIIFNYSNLNLMI